MRKLAFLFLFSLSLFSVANASTLELRCTQLKESELNYLFCSMNPVVVFLVQPGVEEDELQCRIQQDSSIIQCKGHQRGYQMLKIRGEEKNLKLEVVQ